MSTALLFCANCGAANQPQAGTCFACGQALSAAATPASGDERVVKDRYRLVRQVGTGGFGAVYLAEDMLAGKKQVALKEIRLAGLSAQEKIEATDAFNREVSLLPGLQHPHLPRVYDHFTDAQHWYVIMEFIAGETLESYVQKIPSGRLPVEMVVGMGIQLADVLDYLHTRQPPVIFRDLKPSNIMRTPEGKLYLIDFGIARIFKPGQPRDTIAFGSPGYAAPEQYGKAQTTARADLYSLGATLHFLLTGDDPANSPFRFDRLDLSLSPAVDELEWLILCMVAMDVDSRPQSAQAVKRELEEIARRLAQERLRALYPLPPTPQPIAPAPVYVPSSSQWTQVATTGAANGRGQAQAMAGQISGGQQGAQSSKWKISRRKTLAGLLGLGALALAGTGGVRLIDSLLFPPNPYVYHGHTKPVTCLSWSPDNRRIASSSYDGTVQVWYADGGTILAYRNHHAAVWTVAWQPEGSMIASGGQESIVQVWEADTGNSYSSYAGHSAGIEAVAWSPDGLYIASASDDKTVQVWDAANPVLLIRYTGHTDKVMGVAWSPDGRRIASCSNDTTVQVWDAADGTSLLIYTGHTAHVNALAWSPSGNSIASASDDGTVQVWDARTGTRLLTYTGHSGSVWGLSWELSDTDLIASTGGDDSTAQVWDADTGGLIDKYRSKAAWLCAIAWSFDGQRLAFADASNAVNVWRPADRLT
jgi:WD40 repeat protein